jgi:hypothetical protein
LFCATNLPVNGLVACDPCGAPTKTTSGPCRRRVCGSPPCWQHRNGPPLESDANGRDARRDGRTDLEALGTDGRSARRDALTDPEVQVAEAISQLLGDGWQDLAADHIANILGDELWPEFQRSGLNAGICEALALAAREVLSLGDVVPDAAGEFAAHVAEKAGGGKLPCKIAQQVAKCVMRKMMLPIQAKLELIAAGLRAIGIYICSVLGQIESCPCLHDWLKAKASEAIKETILGTLKTIDPVRQSQSAAS